ncbi:MAG: sensor histidine kinase [Synechococcales bacterium]|nr:sensor histidine kinase [Synechococcales bacterium]
MTSRSANTSYPSIPTILRYVEWTILTVILVIILHNPAFSSWNILPHWIIFPCLAAFTGLSFVFPSANSLDSRQIFISSVLNYTGGYIIATVFVLLFSHAMIAERKSRQRAESLSQEVETLAAALERTRIAQEIHDSLGHTLTTLDVQLEVAQKLRQRDPDCALQALDTAKQLASQSLQDVRHALHTLRSSTVNLNEAVLSLVEQVRQTRDLTIHTDLNLPHLPLQVSHQLYCVVKEALMNVQKHSQATQVMMNSIFEEDSLLLSLSDNGIGFDPNQPYSRFGLRGMQERVEMLGGSFKISSTIGQGTLIQAHIPFTTELDAPSTPASDR